MHRKRIIFFRTANGQLFDFFADKAFLCIEHFILAFGARSYATFVRGYSACMFLLCNDANECRLPGSFMFISMYIDTFYAEMFRARDCRFAKVSVC